MQFGWAVGGGLFFMKCLKGLSDLKSHWRR